MLKYVLKKIIKKAGYRLIPIRNDHSDMWRDEEFLEYFHFCRRFTMCSIEKLYALYCSMIYVVDNKVDGSFVECGVWKGGSVMLMCKFLKSRNIDDRKIYLYDTFEGMTKPGEYDISNEGKSALGKFNKLAVGKNRSKWAFSPIEEVQRNIESTGYNENNIFYVKGDVIETLPHKRPGEPIALLRLDTDWYESTKHELEHLYPILSEGGFLIVDDYGHWLGSKKAVDEFFSENNIHMFLNRIDHSARMGIKNKVK